MSRAVRSHRPGQVIAVVHFEENGTGLIEQNHGTVVVRQIIRVRPENAGDAVSVLQIGWRSCDDQKTASRQSCSIWKGVVDAAGELITTHVLRLAARIEKLDEL